MIWKDVIAGFLISRFVIVFVPQWVWNTLFLQGDGLLVSAENAIMGVAIAGISFVGVIASVYADLITIPVPNVYRKYYGWKVMLYILGIFFVTMAFTGFLMEELFNALDIGSNLTGGQTASEQTYFELNYTFYLNIIAFALSGFLIYVYRRGLGAPGQYRDPVCERRIDNSGPSLTYDGKMYYFCSNRCKRSFENRPAEFAQHHPQVSGAGSSQGHEHH